MFAARPRGGIQRKSRSGYPEISPIAHLKKGLLFSQIRGFGRGLWNSSLFPPERDNRDGPIVVTNAVSDVSLQNRAAFAFVLRKNGCKKTTIQRNIKISFSWSWKNAVLFRWAFFCGLLHGIYQNISF